MHRYGLGYETDGSYFGGVTQGLGRVSLEEMVNRRLRSVEDKPVDIRKFQRYSS